MLSLFMKALRLIFQVDKSRVACTSVMFKKDDYSNCG